MIVDTIQESHTGPTLDEAFDYCAHITSAHYENFPVASLFLPRDKRPYIQAIYAFSRIADDIADEVEVPKDERLARLNQWEDKLQQCYAGVAEHPIFVALQETVRRTRIPVEPLNDLLKAFKRDVTQTRYRSFEDLLSYCSCSANPVGRLVLMIFGHRDDALFNLSDAICTALQLANMWQDVFVDRLKDRLYIPMEDMLEYGYTVEDWRNGVEDEHFRALMKFQVERTRDLFYRGAELPSLIEKELQVELRLIWFGGMAILRMLEKVHYDVLKRRPSLNSFHKLLILFRGLWYNDLRRDGKKKKSWDLT